MTSDTATATSKATVLEWMEDVRKKKGSRRKSVKELGRLASNGKRRGFILLVFTVEMSRVKYCRD